MMKYAFLSVVMALAVSACSDDDGETELGPRADASTTSTSGSSTPSASCVVPTGTYPVSATVTTTGAGCSLPSNTITRTFQLDGTLRSFEASSCSAKASWESGPQCVVRIDESCADGLETTTRVAIVSQSLSGTISATNGRCSSEGSFLSTRPTSAPTPTAGNLNVQLLYQNGVDAGLGVYLSYRRYILRSTGQFDACEYAYAVGRGVSGEEPAKRTSGTYEISGGTLRLRESTGTTKSLSFSYSAANREATIDGRYYEQESQVQSSSDVCDFD